MAAIFRSRGPRSFRRTPYKLSWILFAALLLLLWSRLPKPRKSHRKHTPHYAVADKPRFLFHSRFRDHPDYEYEATIDNLLRNIEDEAASDSGAILDAKDTVWQIRLDDDATPLARDPSSIKFERANDDWEYQLVTRASAASFVEDVFANVPDLRRAYHSYPYDVLRADLLRYLLLWYYGGYYADADIYPARSIKECPALDPLFRSNRLGKPKVSLVLGVEIDEPYASPDLLRDWRWTRSYQFIQYTMYAPRRFSPLLRRAIVRTLAHTRLHHQQSNIFSRSVYSQNSVLEISGPGMFTDAILDTLSETLPRTHPLVATSVEKDRDVGELSSASAGSLKRVTWAPFHGLKESVWVDAADAVDMGGLGVVPVRVWGNGQRHSGAGNFGVQEACVHHWFGGTWKKSWREHLFGY